MTPKSEDWLYSDRLSPLSLTLSDSYWSLQRDELEQKQKMRNLEMFLDKLKDIKLVFQREVSSINKNVTTKPVEALEVLESLNKRYNLGIKKEDFRMEQGLDTIGEHFVTVVYKSEQFNKDFTFFVKVQLRPKAAATTTAAADKATTKV